MNISDELKTQGWYLKDDFLANYTEAKDAIAAALHMDLRDVGANSLPLKREDSIPGRVVLQMTKARNISAPKANEESKAAPRFLQLELTDGHNTLFALDMESLPALSLTMLPGTKLYLRPERLPLTHGFFMVRPGDIEVLGGRVELLVEKWEFARTMQLFARSGRRASGVGGPPPWVAFGKKMEALAETLPNEKDFKSLAASIEKEGKANDEFNNMRSVAIAEATKAGARKTFGGGGQNILDHNMKKILEKGYDEEAAKDALRYTNNNLERALYNLKRRQEDGALPPPVVRNARPMRENNGRRGFHSAREEEADLGAKPASNVSLFDFLTDKLPVNSETASVVSTPAAPITAGSGNGYTNPFSKEAGKGRAAADSKPHYRSNNSTQENRSKFQNNISSSFNANSHNGAPPRKSYAERSGAVDGQNLRSKGGVPPTLEAKKVGQYDDAKKRQPPAAKMALVEINQNHPKGRVTGYQQAAAEAPPAGGANVRYSGQSKNNGYDKQNVQKNRPVAVGGANRNNGVTTAPVTSTTVGKSDIEALVEAAAKLKLAKQRNEKQQQQQQRQKIHHSQATTFSQSQQQQQHQIAQYPQAAPAEAPNYQNRGPRPLPSAQQYPVGAVSSPANSWPWRIGDLCMAKYWDDGRYYDAKITAVSETTCVVFYLNYGNHEEVLKNDMLPVTDATYQPLAMQPVLEANVVPQSMAFVPKQPGDFVQHHQRTPGTGGPGGPNAAQPRRERQMYVPPHKRYN